MCALHLVLVKIQALDKQAFAARRWNGALVHSLFRSLSFFFFFCGYPKSGHTHNKLMAAGFRTHTHTPGGEYEAGCCSVGSVGVCVFKLSASERQQECATKEEGDSCSRIKILIYNNNILLFTKSTNDPHPISPH